MLLLLFSTLHYTILHYTTLHYTTLHGWQAKVRSKAPSRWPLMQSIKAGANAAAWAHLLDGRPLCFFASASQQALKAEKLHCQNLAANTRAQLGFSSSSQRGLPVAARWPLSACDCGGTRCSRHVSLLAGTTASSKLPVLRRSCFVARRPSLISSSFSLHIFALRRPAAPSAVQLSRNHTVCVRNSHIRRFARSCS